MKATKLRQTILTAAIVSLLTLAGCATTDDGSTETDADAATVAEVASIDHGVAALPSADELPAGFELDYRCPGGDFCPPTADHDEAPRVTTVSRLAAALPTEDDLPADHEVSVRCPGDSACSDERQDQDASLSVDLVQGRDQADAVDTVRQQIAGFFARLTAAP